MEDTIIAVSTTFYPGSTNDPLPSDTTLVTTDLVYFYAHSHIILGASENGFKGLLPFPKSRQYDHVISVIETSTVFNIVLHAIYDKSCAGYSPPFDALVSAVVALEKYGVHPKALVSQSQPLFTILLSYAPLYPLELYALASRYNLYDLAVNTSSHLLTYPLSALSDEMSEWIGPKYLKRLFFLHLGRSDALKRLLASLPRQHAPTSSCDFAEQKKLARAWTLASASLTWDTRPGGFLRTSLGCTNIHHLKRSLCKCHRIHSSLVGGPFDLPTLPIFATGED
jgi:hypothetical protein